jgi:hypothetical protein
MKSVQLKKVPMTVFGELKEFSYKEMIQVILESPSDPTKGLSIDEVRKSIRILDVLEKSGDVLQVEDADFSHLLSKVRATKFSTANKVFVDFVEDFEKAEKNV